MCGKFTAMASWRQVHAFSQPLTTDVKPKSEAPDEVVTYTPMRDVPVLVFDRQTGERKTVPMRWGFPKSPRNPYEIHVHARSEGFGSTAAFTQSFLDGQRGIVVMRTFNEGRDYVTERGATKTEQWTIDPLDGVPRGFAFLWKEFQFKGTPQLCCVMVTVPANKLIAPITDRMPAILEDADWNTWLGANDATREQTQAVLKTMEGVNWKAAPEPKKTQTVKTQRTAKTREPTLF